ncbi:MAG: site-specific DNA-methyltransferase [Spirochaetia bacterium]|nr:site-specific DNA-methyltransferase [Spirochaetia bacterium]
MSHKNTDDKKNNEKTKAPNNRTLQLSKEEEPYYQKKTVSQNQALKADFKELINKTINADLFEFIEKIPSESIDLVIADPPYNLTKSFNSSSFKRTNDEEYENWLHSWLNQIKRIMKENASVYICCDWQSSPLIYNCAKDYFIPQNRITWEREKGRGAKTNWKNSLEDIYFFTKSKNYKFNIESVKIKKRVIAPYVDEKGNPKDWDTLPEGKFRLTHPSNFWGDITIPFWSMPENTDHPTQKSEKLVAKLILASSDENDLILDPFSGSGTTLVTAKKLRRRFIGIEKDLMYCCLTEKRLELAEKDKSIQGYHDNVFWERNSLVK